MLTSAEATELSAARDVPRAQPDERLFRAHFDSLPGPAYIWQRGSDDFVLVAFNRAAGAVHFSRVADLLGKRTRDLVEATGHDLRPDLEAAAAGGGILRREVDYRYIATHTVRRLAISVIALSPDIVVLHTDDVTEQRRTEQAHRESEGRLHALLDANPDLVVRVDRDGRYLDVHCNDAGTTRHLPHTPADVIGRTVAEMFGADFARQHEYHRLRALATGGVERWEYMRPVGGAERYFESRFVKSGDNEVVITVRDITQRVLLEREVIASTERERTRIGHDLHDGLAQVLIGVKLMLEALREKLPSGSPQRGDTESAAALVTRAITEAGELAQGLSPIRKGGRLSDALRHLARESQELLGVPCDVTRADMPTGVSESTATHLYRIAQEAITNAVKHGNAKRIELACRREREQLVLTIADDGRGVCVTSVDAGGMGMHIMRYRARSIGGDLAVERRPGGGTLVKCCCPYPPSKGHT